MKLRILPLIALLAVSGTSVSARQQNDKNGWLAPFDFSATQFSEPPLYCAPFTRWWWPGGDVEKAELQREIKLFADNHFGGVEIQPLALVFPTKGKGRADRIMSYDTPVYYENLDAVMQAAREQGITVDMTCGSGWPSGGPHLDEADNNQTLSYGLVRCGTTAASQLLPRACRGDRPTAKLVALLAARSTKGDQFVEAGGVNLNGTLALDPQSVRDITSTVTDSTFSYKADSNGIWYAIALWQMADMEAPQLSAKRNPGFAVNHFDSVKVNKNYEHYFGQRTGLDKYYGSPLRCIFNDSYEFRCDRHFSDYFMETFRKNRGYDATKILPANIWVGYNNMYERINHPGNQPAFTLGETDWRMRYDYDLTLSEVLAQQFVDYSSRWAESKGMLHRTQPYGFNMDIMAVAGSTSIPEVETMLFSKGSEAGYKLITSAAHLYNRPLISSESAVYIRRAFMTTPQKLKLTIDKLLTSGINHIVWHGVPYRYFPDAYPEEGWYPFWNARLGVNFSSNLGEADPFWKDMDYVNRYAQRLQYVMRSGKPQADVLIYYPFLGFSEDTQNPAETFTCGVVEGVEPPLKADNNTAVFGQDSSKDWLDSIYPLINELNQRGITWDWINDASIQEMTAEKGKLNVRGNRYQAVILYDLPFIQLKSAERLQTLSKQNGNIVAIGKLPTEQPSYLNYADNDAKTAAAMQTLKHFSNLSDAKSWIETINSPIRLMNQSQAMRSIRRVMADGSLATLFWNEQAQDLDQQVKVGGFSHAYWLDATDGSIVTAPIKDGIVTRHLAGFQTAVLYLSNKPLANATAAVSLTAQSEQEIGTWNFQAGDVKKEAVSLFDWRDDAATQHLSDQGHYTATFNINKVKKGECIVLDLGTVYHSADVTVNGQQAGTVCFSPYVLDITSLVKKGENSIEVVVTPTVYNRYVGMANEGDKLFKTLKGSSLMSQGLIGPVKVITQK